MKTGKRKILTISYKRLPDKTTRTPFMVLYENTEAIVVLNLLNPSKPLIVGESVLLAKDYIGVWFFSNKDWHDLGAIYDRENRFKGYYCDICTPMKKVSDGYESTDFFLDLWIFSDGRYLVLDQDEFNIAVKQGWMNQEQIAKAKTELDNLVRKVKSKQFPPLKIKNLLKLPEDTDEIINSLEHFTNNACI